MRPSRVIAETVTTAIRRRMAPPLSLLWPPWAPQRGLTVCASGVGVNRSSVAVSGRREQEPSFFTVVVWRDQAEHGRGPAPAAKLDGRGQQRPIDGRGRGRGAGTEPAVGDGCPVSSILARSH